MRITSKNILLVVLNFSYFIAVICFNIVSYTDKIKVWMLNKLIIIVLYILLSFYINILFGIDG